MGMIFDRLWDNLYKCNSSHILSNITFGHPNTTNWILIPNRIEMLIFCLLWNIRLHFPLHVTLKFSPLTKIFRLSRYNNSFLFKEEIIFLPCTLSVVRDQYEVSVSKCFYNHSNSVKAPVLVGLSAILLY